MSAAGGGGGGVSELTTLRDHAREMAASEHRPECKGVVTRIGSHLGLVGTDLYRVWTCDDESEHEPHRWVDDFCIEWKCQGICPGCIPDSERALWVQIRDEIDAYLTRNDEGPGLFGEGA